MLTAEILEGFVNSMLRKNFDGAAETPQFHRELWALCCGTDRYVAVAAPRGFAKSTAVTYSYTLASVLFRQSSYVLIVSDTTTQSIQFLGDIKRELQDNEDICELFGITEWVKDTEDDIIVRMDDGHAFRIQAKGAEQKLRGLKWANKRPDLIIGDDLENDEIVMNKDRREKFRRWFYGALLPCLSDKGKVRLVGTILHLDAMLERLMPEHQLGHTRQKQIIRTELKEYTNVKCPWKSVKYRAHNEDYSALLWPDKKPAELLKQIREDYIRQGLPDVYSQEYLNVPLDESHALFRRTDFLPMKSDDKKRKFNYYIAADLAVSTEQRRDYSVFVVGGMDDNGVLHVVNVIKDRLDSMQVVDTILALERIYKPQSFAFEKGVIQKSIGPFLNEAMLKQNTFVNLRLLTPSGDKVTRARSIIARMRAGGVRFDKEAEWFTDIEDEMLKFPRAKHDDQVDAMAYLGLICDKLIEGPTKEQLDEEEYEQEFGDYRSQYDGRNQTTGY